MRRWDLLIVFYEFTAEIWTYVLLAVNPINPININPSKHLNRSALHLNNLGTPLLTVNFLDVLNSLDSEQWLEWKGSSNSDKNSSKSEALNEVTFLSRKFTKNIFFGYLNINYVKNKLEALEFPTKDKFGVFLVSESNLDSSFPETQFRIPIYRIFRQVRNKYGGGDFQFISSTEIFTLEINLGR